MLAKPVVGEPSLCVLTSPSPLLCLEKHPSKASGKAEPSDTKWCLRHSVHPKLLKHSPNVLGSPRTLSDQTLHERAVDVSVSPPSIDHRSRRLSR